MLKKIQLKKIFTISILFLLIGIAVFPIIESNEIQSENVILKYKNRDIPLLKELEPVGTYKEYINGLENKPFIFQKISESTSKSSPLVVIFINSDIVDDISDEIALYNETLGYFGYETVMFEVSGVSPSDLKNQLTYYWEEDYNLCGSVLIGDLPTEWFHHENDFYGPDEFPCDLFLMDLDGIWADTDEDDMYDTHTDGSGDTSPEIYVGRIDASKIPGDEISILKKYFDKVYDFWSGNTNQTLSGLTYTDQDWAGYEDFRHDIGYAYENYEAIWYPDVNRDDYVFNRVPGTYEFIQLSCHSSAQGHSFTTGGWATNEDIRNAPPEALFYNLFCCSSLRFTEYNCLGYAYILDTDTPSLSVVGSAKTGSMLDFRYFYEPIGNGSSFGTALKEWFEYEYPYDDTDKSWFYGITILGDPTLIIHLAKNFPPSGENLTGPDEGIIGEHYTFCIDVYDQEHNNIYCKWDWGDGTITDWTGPYANAEKVCTTHSWSSSGDYEIKVNLKDDMGSESGWIEPHHLYILQTACMKIGKVQGGFLKINVELKNIGEMEATNVQWKINVDGGVILTGRESTGTTTNIAADGTIGIESKYILGFGKVSVKVEAEIPENTATREVNGKVILFYININPSGE